MATKQLYATGTFRYGTRRLQAGDPVDMTGPHRRLYLALGKVTEDKPKVAAAPKAPEPPKAVESAKAPAKKAPARKRTTRSKKKAAK